MLRNRLWVRLFLGALCIGGGAGLFLFLSKPPPSPAVAAYERGQSLANARMTEAVAAYKEAIRLDPHYPPPYRALAEIASEQDDLPQAIVQWKEYLTREPRATHAWCRLAGAWMRAHRGTEALRAAKEELKLDAACGRANLIAGQLYEGASQVRSALTHLAAAVRAYPNEPRIQMAYARVLARSGDMNRAEPLLKEVIARDPESAEAYRWLGSIYARRVASPENARLTEQNLRRALELNPDYAEAHSELAQFLFAHRRAADASPHAERAATLRKHYPQALYLQARIYETLGRHTEAERVRKAFQRENALSLRQETLRARYLQDKRNVKNALELARVLIARDAPGDALAILRKVAPDAPQDAEVKALLEQAEASVSPAE
jgi:predicted Zn-dependent protease